MQKFDTPTPISATLDIPAGRIQFIAAERTDTTVEVLPANASKGRDVTAAQQTKVEYADGVLWIQAPPEAGQIFGASGSIEVTVHLPAGSRVEAKAVAAEFQGVGRLGDVSIEGANGATTIDEIASLRLTALAGDVTVGRLNGPAEISTRTGNIHIAEATSGIVVLRTQMGDVTVNAAHGVSASLDAGTSYGRIHDALKNTDGAAAGLSIHASTDHGNITARSL
ncbi:DUF4097 family beta strand repeat-containing protein [Micromonospora lupini]|uniref:DUF4097 family beta strand repeat-containing protein n=1 Tax=Micromonospora lupini TaxID=285679 RepID=UPI0033EE8466